MIWRVHMVETGGRPFEMCNMSLLVSNVSNCRSEAGPALSNLSVWSSFERTVAADLEVVLRYFGSKDMPLNFKYVPTFGEKMDVRRCEHYCVLVLSLLKTSGTAECFIAVTRFRGNGSVCSIKPNCSCLPSQMGCRKTATLREVEMPACGLRVSLLVVVVVCSPDGCDEFCWSLLAGRKKIYKAAPRGLGCPYNIRHPS